MGFFSDSDKKRAPSSAPPPPPSAPSEAPPPYYDPNSNPALYDTTGEKARLPQQQQQQQQQQSGPHPSTSAAQQAAVPTQNLSITSGGPPICFHIYKANGMFDKDDIITGPDKSVCQYHLVFPRQMFSNAWDLTLRRGGIQGPEVLRITKSGWSSEKLITMANGWQTPLVRSGTFSSSHEFTGFDGKTVYKWKSPPFSSDWELLKRTTPTGPRHIVAVFSAASFSFSKDGTLHINNDFASETELILGSALAMEEWAREQRERR